MDDTDTQLIAALRRDARMALSDLAALVGVSRATARARLARLRADGIILGYSVVLAGDVAQHPVRGMMMLGIEGRGATRIARILGGIDAVRAIHATNGKWDLIVELGTATLPDLDAVLTRIRELDGVATSETSLLLTTRMSTGTLTGATLGS